MPDEEPNETYNPWSVVNLVFHQLAKEGLHPVLGNAGDATLLQRLLNKIISSIIT